ncbi:MAG: DUF2147 domain-containing protein [Pedobacter sp.]|nr:MAG: DUF2147 domain-containing protein [Pedobacter sp.]
MKKIIRAITSLTFISLVFLTAVLAQTTADKITGEWLNEQKDKKILVFQASDGSFAAKITWLKEAAEGGSKTGAIIIKDLKLTGQEYTGGQIFTPKHGWVKGKAAINTKGQLELTGNQGFFSKTQTWSRP